MVLLGDGRLQIGAKYSWLSGFAKMEHYGVSYEASDFIVGRYVTKPAHPGGSHIASCS